MNEMNVRCLVGSNSVPNVILKCLGLQGHSKRAKSLELKNPLLFFWISLFVEVSPVSLSLSSHLAATETKPTDTLHTSLLDTIIMEKSDGKRTIDDSIDTSKKRCCASDSTVVLDENSNTAPVHVRV